MLDMEPSKATDIPRYGDLITAIHIPKFINYFKYYFDEDTLIYDIEIKHKPMEVLIKEEKATHVSLDYKQYITRDLDSEKSHFWESKCKIYPTDETEINGETYKRVVIGYPFIPHISMAYSTLKLQLFEKCSIFVEYCLLSTVPRKALVEGNIYALRNSITTRETIPRDIPFRSLIHPDVYWIVRNGKIIKFD